jgi:hypothetical protein
MNPWLSNMYTRLNKLLAWAGFTIAFFVAILMDFGVL